MDFLQCLSYISEKFIPKSYTELRHPSKSILLNLVQLRNCRIAILMQSSEKSLAGNSKGSHGLMEVALVDHECNERYEQGFPLHLLF